MKEDKKESNKNKNVDELTKELLQYRKQYVQNLKELKQTEEELPELEYKIQELQKDYAAARGEFNKTLERSWWSILPGAIFDLFVETGKYLRGKEPTETAIARTDKELKELLPKKEQAENRLKELKENNEKLIKQIEETKKQISQVEAKKREEKNKKEEEMKKKMEEEQKRIIEEAKKKEKVKDIEMKKPVQNTNQKINDNEVKLTPNIPNRQNIQKFQNIKQDNNSNQFANDSEWLYNKINGFISFEELQKICDFCNGEELCSKIKGKQDLENLIDMLKEANVNTFQSFHDTLVDVCKQTLQNNNMLPEGYNEQQYSNFDNFKNYTNFLIQSLSQYNDYDNRLFNIIKNNDDQRVSRAEQKLNELKEQQHEQGFFAKILSFFFDYNNLRAKIAKAKIEHKNALKLRTKNRMNMLRNIDNKNIAYTDAIRETSDKFARSIHFGGIEDDYNNYTMQQSVNNSPECNLDNGIGQQSTLIY